MIWTEVLNVQLDVLKQLQVSVKADGSGNEPAKARVAIQAGALFGAIVSFVAVSVGLFKSV